MDGSSMRAGGEGARGDVGLKAFSVLLDGGNLGARKTGNSPSFAEDE